MVLSLFSNMWDFFQVQVTAFMLKMSLAPITANGYIVNWFLIDANDISNINVATCTWLMFHIFENGRSNYFLPLLCNF